jgi:hypothetical protein
MVAGRAGHPPRLRGQGSAVAGYAHAPDTALLQAADAVAARIAMALDGGAEVIALPQAA